MRLIEHHRDADTDALLLEACVPGTALSASLPPAEQDVVAASLLRRLWIEPPPYPEFRPLEQMCEFWAAEFEQKHLTRLTGLGREQDAGLLRAGVELFRELPATAQVRVLLCTDLHPDNILAAQRQSWLVIDPKPYVGDPSYDPLQYLMNFPDRLIADPRGFGTRLAGLLDLDAGRLLLWLFARCVLGCADEPRLWSAVVQLAP